MELLNVTMFLSKLIFYIVFFFAGASVFSFLNVVVARVPRHETFMKGTSHCENCGHALEQKDMVPIFSWLRLKGKCRYCGSPVSPEYTIVEALGGLAAVVLVILWGISLQGLLIFLWIAMTFLLVMFLREEAQIPFGAYLIMLILSVVSVVSMNGKVTNGFIQGIGLFSGVYKFSLPVYLQGYSLEKSVLLKHFQENVLGLMVMGTPIFFLRFIVNKLREKNLSYDFVMVAALLGFFLGVKASLIIASVTVIIYIIVTLICQIYTKQATTSQKHAKMGRMGKTGQHNIVDRDHLLADLMGIMSAVFALFLFY